MSRNHVVVGAVLVLVGSAGLHAQSTGTQAIPNLAGKALTVQGPIDPAALGQTLMHEHIFIDFKAPETAVGYELAMQEAPQGAPANPGQNRGRGMGQGPGGGNAGGGGLTNYDEQLAEVMQFKKAGGGTIVDVTNIGLSRNPEGLLRVSKASGLNVIMGAGWYMKTLHPADMNQRTVEDLTRIIVHDITVGVKDTGIRSGIIGEVGTGAFGDRGPLTENELKSVRASARASRLTGAPISFHSFAPPEEMQKALDIVQAEGVDLNHVVMGHTGTGDVAAMKRYTDRGAYVEFDFIGQAAGSMGARGSLQEGAERLAANIKTLIDAGLTERILVAHDVCIAGQLTKNGGGGYAYISNMVVPALEAKGVSRKTIQTILVDNPRRVLTFVAPQPLVRN